ncbi:hypothetical protein BKA70DRAFT_1531223 [Coprinopsis sp. MPI-PUGE-AT-0042]|nr:hypothetical protein BKA70DRAFT_1531223 [Coprinopsis sp. MPI-PUGE-AT-0042]
MIFSLTVVALTFGASVARAEDVTLFIVGTPTASETTTSSGHFTPHQPSFSLLGASPLSVDEAGVTQYAYSHIVSWAGEVGTKTNTFEADATRILEKQTVTLDASESNVLEGSFECVHLENGTSVCKNIVIEKGPMYTTTKLESTFTGTPVPWVTIKNVETALLADGGGADRTWGHASRMAAVFASLGLGAALVLV